MEITRVEQGSALWTQLIDYAENSPWVAGAHLAHMLWENRFEDWESVFAAMKDGQIIGYCTFLKTDYYPENRYSPLDQLNLCSPRAQGPSREPEDDRSRHCLCQDAAFHPRLHPLGYGGVL